MEYHGFELDAVWTSRGMLLLNFCVIFVNTKGLDGFNIKERMWVFFQIFSLLRTPLADLLCRKIAKIEDHWWLYKRRGIVRCFVLFYFLDLKYLYLRLMRVSFFAKIRVPTGAFSILWEFFNNSFQIAFLPASYLSSKIFRTKKLNDFCGGTLQVKF